MSPDLVNGLFETFAGMFILLSCRQLYRDKLTRGVSAFHIGFFMCWGYWNLFFYPYVGQWLSFYSGVSVAIINTLWLVMFLYYKRREQSMVKATP